MSITRVYLKSVLTSRVVNPEWFIPDLATTFKEFRIQPFFRAYLKTVKIDFKRNNPPSFEQTLSYTIKANVSLRPALEKSVFIYMILLFSRNRNKWFRTRKKSSDPTGYGFTTLLSRKQNGGLGLADKPHGRVYTLHTSLASSQSPEVAVHLVTQSMSWLHSTPICLEDELHGTAVAQLV